jgi:membrane protease YdiL (CAAX protease family)
MPITHVVDVRHEEPEAELRRRRRVVGVTAVAGAGLLGLGLSTRPGSRAFYATTLGVAGVWTAGGFASGRLHRGWIQLQDRSVERPVMVPLATGVAAFGGFYGAALVAKRIPVLSDAVSSVLDYAEEGSRPLVLATTLANGVAEEVFFRGAVYSALGQRHPVAASTAVYTVATTATRNPALVLAAAAMGTLFGLQRRASGGLQAPTLTHLTWSALMLRYLPPVFRDPDELAGRGRWAPPRLGEG